MNKTGLIRVGALIAVLIVGAGAIFYSTAKKSVSAQLASGTTAATAESTTTTTSPASGAQPQTATASSIYKDGTYTATGSYLSPGGDEKIGVTLTLQNDVVTAANVTPEPVSEEGKHHQAIFAANFKQYVIGKNVADVHLTAISGSSLTPTGFNDALAQIKTQAKV